MTDTGRIFFRLVATFLCFVVALYSLLSSYIGMFIAFFVVVIWYFLVGHHIVGALLDRVSKSSFAQDDISGGFEKKVDSLLGRGKTDEARELCRSWMKQDPENSAPHLRFCAILAGEPEGLEGAIRHMETCFLRRFTAEHHIAIGRELARLYRQAGRPEAAEPVVRRLRDLYPGSPHMQDLQ
jgi:hypothetical protein